MNSSRLTLDAKSPTPLWSQIEQQVRLAVADGWLAVGDPVPSVRDLAQELMVNPATVAKAYRRLVAAGVLETRRGLGTFVAMSPPAEDLARAEAREAALRMVAVCRAGGIALESARQVLDEVWRDQEEGAERHSQKSRTAQRRKEVG